nr:DNA methyltransferase [Tsukamurella pseudospumae]
MAAARYLSERVVEAWTAEDPSNAARKDLYTRAIRQVVANCLYGADINDMAVEMCKLSLWLVSLDRDLPFSFVDDKVLLGNSLLGVTDLDQLRRLHIDPKVKTEMADYYAYDVDIDSIIDRAKELRRTLLTEINEDDPARTSAAKRRQLADFRQVTTDLRRIANGVVAVGLAHGGKPGKALNEAYDNLRIAVGKAFPDKGKADDAFLSSLIDFGLTPVVVTDYERWQPLHWVIEAPDVMIDNGGFDAVIGNPPFLGGIKISAAMGGNVREWLSGVLATGGSGGRADLVAYFFLRATSLLQAKGTLGLIATNTVAQGDSREVSLDAMVASGFTITRAIQSRSWPASSANLEYAAVWGTVGPVADEVPRISDDAAVRRISTLLEPAGRATGTPVRLAENSNVTYEGMKPYGQGFILTPDEAQLWIAADARNTEVLFPYLNGEDLNSRPDASPSRWAIDFNDWPEERAAEFVEPFDRVLKLVRPERQRRKPDGAFVLRRPLPERWWQYGDKRPALRRAIKALPEVLVIALVSKTVMPMRVSTGQVFSHALGVFATDDYGVQAVLSSSLHQIWAITYGSGMRNDPRYTPSDVFDTFPRPVPSEDVVRLGRVLDKDRREIMLRRDLGLTKLYNLVNNSGIIGAADPDVAHLRDIHVQLDRVVLQAYGYDDIDPGHGFHEFRKVVRWTVSPAARVEILDRLLEEMTALVDSPQFC